MKKDYYSEVQYSILKYRTTPLSGECINLGILFFTINKECGFIYTNNFERVHNFDIKMDINLIKDLLQGINEEITNLTKDKKINIFDIENYIKYFNNNFYFSKIFTSWFNLYNTNDTIAELKRRYLPFG